MNCFLKHVTEGKTEGRIKVTGRQRRRCKQLLDNFQLKTGSWKLRGSTRSHSWKKTLDLSYDRLQNKWIRVHNTRSLIAVLPIPLAEAFPILSNGQNEA